MGQWLQRLVSSAKYGTVSDATIQGYLRSASQIEQVWQQTEEKVQNLLFEGKTPWDAYAELGYALAFVRVCRLHVLFAQELLKANAASNQVNAGQISKLTYDQALVLCENIEPMLEEAIKASGSSYRVSSFPLTFGPHIQSDRVPVPHLQGVVHGVQESKSWVEGLFAQYELALPKGGIPVPKEVNDHLVSLRNEMDLAQFHFQSGVDMVGMASQGQTTNELAKKADGLLWEAIEGYAQVVQLLARPGRKIQPAKSPNPLAEEQRIQQYRPEPVKPFPPSHPVQRYVNSLPVEPKRKSVEEETSDLLSQIISQPESDVQKKIYEQGLAEGRKYNPPPKKSLEEDTLDLLREISGK